MLQHRVVKSSLFLAWIISYYTLYVRALAPSGPWDTFNIAPKSRTVYPTAIHSSHGDVSNAESLTNNPGNSKTKTATLKGNGTWVALDFGLEVGGLISMNLYPSSSSQQEFSLSFTESPLYIRPTSSDDSALASQSTTYDGVLHVNVPLPSSSKSGSVYWTQPSPSLRGGFRYLTIVSNNPTDHDLIIGNVSCEISFVPHVDDMRAYTGYFYSKAPGLKVPIDDNNDEVVDEDLLTRIWYAGAYTVQTNTIAVNTGRQEPTPPPGTWENNATLGVAGPIIVDGAKRDRAVWPGDMGIAVPTSFVSTNDLVPSKNALLTMFSGQNPKTGALPESGPPLSQQGSDTYHMWTLIGVYNYYMYTGDIEFVQAIWANYTKAVAFVEAKVDSSVNGTHLMDITGTRDWARQGGQGYSAEGNAILYKLLTTASSLATYLNLTALSEDWTRNGTSLKQAFNAAFWDEEVGMYRDNVTTTLCPQDANAFAVLFDVTDDSEDNSEDGKKARVSDGLTKNWVELGPVPPELPDTISPFISGFEIQAHFEAGNDRTALELMRRTWGFMMYTNTSVQSTLLEGFTGNGSLGYRYYRGYDNDPSYTSHAHGWSTGPTSALTFYLLGLSVTQPMGKEWRVAPHIGLSSSNVDNSDAKSSSSYPTEAEGGFETALGWFGAKWSLTSNSNSNPDLNLDDNSDKELELTIEVDVPGNTDGIVVVPNLLTLSSKSGSGGRIVVQVDGKETANLTGGGGGGGEVKVGGGKHVVFAKIVS